MVFLDPLGRWSMISEVELNWFSGLGAAQGGRAGALPPGPIGLPFVPVASGLF